MGNCRPTTHLIQSIMSQKMDWWKALAELADNGFDAGASTVQIEVSNDALTITDDGCGVSNVECLLTLGQHDEHEGPTLGVYGIGTKDAWLSCSDTMAVDSVCNGVRIHGLFDIRDIIEKDFNFTDPVSSQSECESYTSLRFRLRDGKRPPGKPAFDRLAWVFTPAINAGKKIVVKHRKGALALQPAMLPEMSDRVADTFSVDGRMVSIDIGLTNGESVTNGPIWLVFGHRIISGTSLGTGNYGIKNIAGTITLHDEWKSLLTKHKDDLTIETDLLESEIFQRIEPLLVVAQQISETFESVLLTNELSNMLNSTVQKAQRKQGTGKRRQTRASSGTVKPVNTGRRHTSAEEVNQNDGDVKERDCDFKPNARQRGIHVKWYGDANTAILGRFDSVANAVVLNDNNRLIATRKGMTDRTPILMAAVMIIADHEVRHSDGKPVLSFAYDNFKDACGALVDSFAEVDHAAAT